MVKKTDLDNEPDMEEDDSDETSSDDPQVANGPHSSLVSERIVLVVDEMGQRRDETVSIVEKILPNAAIDVADNPEQAQVKMDATNYDTYVINFLMPGFGASPFVKTVTNHPSRPVLMGFAADKMSDAYDPKKGIKIKPLRKLFEIEDFSDSDSDDNEEDEDEEY